MLRVREALQSLPGVAGVEVDFERKTATVTMKRQGTIGREAVEQALEQNGYGVTSFAQGP